MKTGIKKSIMFLFYVAVGMVTTVGIINFGETKISSYKVNNALHEKNVLKDILNDGLFVRNKLPENINFSGKVFRAKYSFNDDLTRFIKKLIS